MWSRADRGVGPVAGSALLLGKSLANSAVAFAVLLAGFAGSAIAMAHQRVVRFEAWPFALVWGLLALPTFFLWTTFVAALYAITKNRYATYALGLGAIVLTAYLRLRGDINWIGNWTLWGRSSGATWGPSISTARRFFGIESSCWRRGSFSWRSPCASCRAAIPIRS